MSLVINLAFKSIDTADAKVKLKLALLKLDFTEGYPVSDPSE